MRLIALLRLFARLEAQFALEYRTNLFFDLLQQVMVIVTSIGAVLVLFSYTIVNLFISQEHVFR